MVDFSGLGSGTGGGLGGAQNVTPAPDAETRFASQLEQLEMMGFTNKTGTDFLLAQILQTEFRSRTSNQARNG